MKSLPTEFSKNGFNFRQLLRDGNVALFAKWNEDVPETYEVILIQSHDGYEIAGSHVEAGEFYPASTSWGQHGWTYVLLEEAKKQFRDLLDVKHQPIANKRGNRTAEPRHLPDGDFTVKQAAEQWRCSIGTAYQTIKKSGAIVVRKESGGKGKPTLVYRKTTN